MSLLILAKGNYSNVESYSTILWVSKKKFKQLSMYFLFTSLIKEEHHIRYKYNSSVLILYPNYIPSIHSISILLCKSNHKYRSITIRVKLINFNYVPDYFIVSLWPNSDNIFPHPGTKTDKIINDDSWFGSLSMYDFVHGSWLPRKLYKVKLYVIVNFFIARMLQYNPSKLSWDMW